MNLARIFFFEPASGVPDVCAPLKQAEISALVFSLPLTRKIAHILAYILMFYNFHLKVLVFWSSFLCEYHSAEGGKNYWAGGGGHPQPVINERPSRNDGEKWKNAGEMDERPSIC